MQRLAQGWSVTTTATALVSHPKRSASGATGTLPRGPRATGHEREGWRTGGRSRTTVLPGWPDNGSAYKSFAFRDLMAEMRRLRPFRPRDRGWLLAPRGTVMEAGPEARRLLPWFA